MDNETEIVKEYVRKLPQGMRDYLAKDTWPQKLSLIAQINKISDEQATALKAEVFLILIGVEKYSDFRTNMLSNVVGAGNESVNNIIDYVEKNIFSEVKPILVEIDKTYDETDKTNEESENLSKESLLHGIENPAPIKPVISNPAGNNPILDAQHNLPEQEKKILISSAAVPSRGPILGNFKVQPTPQPSQPIMPPKPAQPPVQPPQPIQKPPQTPATSTPPAPTKYKVDPYREPTE